MDSSLHAAGTTLVLPVLVPGALLAFGDPHAAQGDGEVCGTGIETAAEVELTVRPTVDSAPPRPRSRLRDLPKRKGPFLVSMGIDERLEEACRQATEDMIAQLVRCGCTEPEAYLLTSLVGDLRISEVVDDPQRVVSLVFPLSTMPSAGRRSAGRASSR